jgi:5-methylcytosine-specific restriction endonuclease McrA
MWADQGGKCSLCGGQMNPVPILLGRGRDPLLASIEHRVPVADIGAAAHTPENVSLAHFVCNTRKGTKSLEEFFSTATMEA